MGDREGLTREVDAMVYAVCTPLLRAEPRRTPEFSRKVNPWTVVRSIRDQVTQRLDRPEGRMKGVDHIITVREPVSLPPFFIASPPLASSVEPPVYEHHPATPQARIDGTLPIAEPPSPADARSLATIDVVRHASLPSPSRIMLPLTSRPLSHERHLIDRIGRRRTLDATK
jgi:hypothetical protein